MFRERKAPAAGRLPQILLATALLGAFAAHPAAAGYETVVTAGTDAPGGAVRFTSTLAPGQEAVVAVPRRAGQPALELRLLRVGDRLELQRPVS